jgi:cation diffusion facilitator CzcD-associated flavoprotein CzcO
VTKLHLFQRTAPWITPRPDRPLTRLEKALYRRVPAAQRAMRRAIYWGRETYAIPMLRARLSRVIRLVALRHLKSQVPDPVLRAKLTPDYAPGCKRILVANDYYPSLTQPNVEVLTGGVKEIREHSVVNADGSEREVDTIIFGTGFHVTDLPIGDHVRGRDGRTFAEVWDGSPQMHRGTTVAGAPNFFLLLGPNTGLGHTSVVLMAEAQARYIAKALEHMRSRGLATVEVKPEAQHAWNAEVQRRMKGTVWTSGGCASWYIDSKGLNTTLWPDFSFRFVRAMREFDPAEHVFEPAALPARVPVAA